jgi:hypothetical protein
MRRQMMFRIIRGAAAMIVGYGVIVVLTCLGFNGVLGSRPLYGGSVAVLVTGMLVAVIAGLAGGYTAGFIGPARGLLNASLVLIPLVGDTIFVLFFFKRSNAAFWFDAFAAATLMVCTLAGGLLKELGGVRRHTTSAKKLPEFIPIFAAELCL